MIRCGWFWVFWCTLFAALPARANDAAFRGAPADLVLRTDLPIVMKSEDITLTATSDMHWNVVAKYVFENDSDTAQQVQVGFPELRCWRSDEYPCGKSRQFQGLETFVEGKQVSLKQGTLAKRAEWASYLGSIWLFDVKFPARSAVRIEHRYRIATSEYSNGERFVEYVIQTGATWKASIGSARFTVRVPPYSLYVRATLPPGLSMGEPRVVDGPNPYVEFVVEGRELEPKGDVTFGFRASSVYDVAVPMGLDLNAPADADADTLIEQLAQIHAAKGYPFRSNALRERFYGKNDGLFRWDKKFQSFRRGPTALATFDRSWFLREDLQGIAILEARLRELGGVFDAPDPLAVPAAPAAPSGSATATSTAPPPAATAAAPSAPTAAPPLATHGCRCEAPGVSKSSSNRGLWLMVAAPLFAVRRRTKRQTTSANRG